jgi:CheY-like chemotaxis protein
MNRIPVLVVDDHQRYRELFCQLLSDCFPNVHPSTAADGSEALRLAELTPFALVVLDYYLPWINGGDVVRQLRARCQHRQVAAPRIVLTTSEPDGARLARIIGADGFLHKPISAEEIRAVIGPMLAQAAEAQEARSPRLRRLQPRTSPQES